MTGRPHVADIVEVLLFTTDRPLPAARIASVVPRLEAGEVASVVEELNAAYEKGGRTFRIREVAGGYRLYTLPEYESYVDALAVTTRESRLSQAALETLAVVAYRQPVSRGDIEYVRGCDCDGVLRTLLGRKLIAIRGRSDAPGRPLLYGTTDRFLEYFGLARLSDLPDFSEIAALVGEPVSRNVLRRVAGRPEEAPPEAVGACGPSESVSAAEGGDPLALLHGEDDHGAAAAIAAEEPASLGEPPDEAGPSGAGSPAEEELVPVAVPREDEA